MCGLLTGSSIDMLPWNLACPYLLSDGESWSDVVGGIQSRFAREKPPTSASDMSLHACMDSGSWKAVRT